jgi:heat shock protein HslJ
MSRTTRIALGVLVGFVVLAGLVTAMVLTHRSSAGTPGDGTSVTSMDQLQGSFVSRSGSSTTPTPLLDGRPVRLVIAGDRIDASAGCNQMGGSLAVDGGHLVVGQLVSTEMACLPDTVMQQERWVLDMLDARPAAHLGGDLLTLTWSGYSLALGRLGAGSPTSTGPTAAPTGGSPVPGPSSPPTTTPPPSLATRPTVGPGAAGTEVPGPSRNTFPETPQASSS